MPTISCYCDTTAAASSHRAHHHICSHQYSIELLWVCVQHVKSSHLRVFYFIVITTLLMTCKFKSVLFVPMDFGINWVFMWFFKWILSKYSYCLLSHIVVVFVFCYSMLIRNLIGPVKGVYLKHFFHFLFCLYLFLCFLLCYASDICFIFYICSQEFY